MSFPSAEQNGVFTHVYWTDDLGFATTYGNTAGVTGTQFSTGMPATVLVITKLTCGSATLNVEIGAAGFTPTFAGGNNTALSLSGTGYQVGVINTAFVFDDSDPITTTLTTDKRYVASQLVTTGVVIAEAAYLVTYELTPGEDWFNGLRSSANAVAGRTTGDGSGVLYLGATITGNSAVYNQSTGQLIVKL